MNLAVTATGIATKNMTLAMVGLAMPGPQDEKDNNKGDDYTGWVMVGICVFCFVAVLILALIY